MKNSYKITLLFVVFSIGISIAQEKINGNKNVTTEDRNLTDFTKIQVIDDFDVYLIYNEKQSVAVEADSNLQDIIITEIKNGVLTLKSSSRIGRSKTLNIHLKVNKNIDEILAYNHSKIFSNNTVIIDSLTLNTFDDAEVNLKLNSKKITFDSKNSSKLNLEILSTTISGKLEDISAFKATLNVQNINLLALDKSSIEVSGTANQLNLEAQGNTQFKGRNLTTNGAIAKVQNNATVYINATEKLELYSNHDSEVNVYSTPTIILHEFYDTSVLKKRELN